MNSQRQTKRVVREMEIKYDLVEPIKLDKSEICFITSFHATTKTFFAQLCKNPIEELNDLDEATNNYCNSIERAERQRLAATKVRPGDFVCAKYRNGLWYRSLILDRERSSQTYAVQMLDYGNIQVIDRADIVAVDVDKLSCFKRQPFGITCSIGGIDTVSEKEAKRALDCLSNNYVLINIISQQGHLQYLVDVPKVCYNMPFWDKFDPETAELLRKADLHCGKRAIRAPNEPLSDEESSDELSVCMFPGL